MRSVFVLALALCPALALASPAISILEPAAIEKSTDAMARLMILKRTTSRLEGKPPVEVTTIEARVEGATGRKADALPTGTTLFFRSQCSRESRPIPDRMAGYPNGRCGTGWTALPAAFADPAAKMVQVRLIVGKDGAVSVVPSTRPATGSLHGTIVRSQPTR